MTLTMSTSNTPGSKDDDDGTTFEIPDANAPNPERESVRREEGEKIHGLLAALDETDRAAIVMRYWHDASEIEISETLGLSVSAAPSAKDSPD